MELRVHSDIVALAGPANAIALARIIERARYEVHRARYMLYADRLLAQDTGLSPDAAHRARQYWQQIGVVVAKRRGMPPVTEYDCHATLERYKAWLEANHIYHYETRAERILRLERKAQHYGIDTQELKNSSAAPHVNHQEAYYEAILTRAIEKKREAILGGHTT